MVAMNLTTLKAQAEAAKASPAELEIWQMEVSPDDVLRLVEVARAAILVDQHYANAHQVPAAPLTLEESLKGIE